MNSRVDPILDLIDGALADPGQHSPESHQYTDVAPTMPAAGTCWRCTTRPASAGSELCAGCRSYLLEDTDADPARSTAGSFSWAGGDTIIITVDPEVTPDATMSWTAIGPPIPPVPPSDWVWPGATLINVADEPRQWADDDPSDVSWSAVSEACDSFGATMAEIARGLTEMFNEFNEAIESLLADEDDDPPEPRNRSERRAERFGHRATTNAGPRPAWTHRASGQIR